MKNITLFLILVFTFQIQELQSQEKIVERSSKKPPEWINISEKNFIIVTAKDITIEDAKNKSINLVRQNMVESVAVFVESKTSTGTKETNQNEVYSIIEEFEATTQIESANMPALQGVSISKAVDTYWEKVRNKKDNNVYYNYYLKYPFPEHELIELLDQFNEYNAALSMDLETLLTSIENTNNLEELSGKKKELSDLSTFFQDNRKQKAELGISQINTIFEGLRLEVIELKSNFINFILKSGDKQYYTSKHPHIKTNCAETGNIIYNENSWALNFETQNCYTDEENYLLIELSTGNKRIKEKVLLDVTLGLVEIYIIGNIQTIKKENKQFQFSVNIQSKYSTPFIINKLSINWPENPALIIDNINQEFSGKGLHVLKVTSDSKPNMQINKNKANQVVSGNIIYTNIANEEQLRYKFFNVTISLE